MRAIKGGIAAASLTLSAGILYTHRTGSLYPGISVGVLVSTVILLLTLYRSRRLTRNGFYLILTATVIVAMLYRSYIFGFPASLIGMDPDGYALGIERLIRTGQTSSIETGFYVQAPLFFVLPAVISNLSAAPASETMIVYPLLVGLLLPMTAAVLTKRVLGPGSYRPIGAAALIAAVVATSVWFAYWPIAQTLALLFWCVLLVAVARILNTGSRADFAIAVLLLMSLVYTHKLPLLVVFPVFLGLLTVHLVRGPSSLAWTWDNVRTDVILVLLASSMLVLQQLYVTDFLGFVTLKIIQLASQDAAAVRPAPPTFSHAEVIAPGISGVIHRQLYAFVLLPLSGLSWLYVALNYRRSSTARVVLVGSAVAVVFIAVGTVATADVIPPYRGTLFGEPLFAVLVAIGLGALLRSRATRWGAVVVVVLVLTSQVLTPVAVPDYDNSQRIYLSSGEVDAKSFGYEYVPEPIYTDSFMQHEDIRPVTSVDGYRDDQYREMNTSLFNATLSESGYEYVLYRDLETFGSPGGWVRLTWDPTTTLRQNFSRVYSNGQAGLYANTTAVG